LVAAHTSAGKTVVAEYAIAKSLKKDMKCVYTSPIKALSNQKYKEFKEKFCDVGIMTGDVTLNEDAKCLIMTTEVLQSMLYRDSEVINHIDCVVFDEAHYLADPDRGYVWEEVIIMLPEHINIVLLSATIPNYKELAGWVGRIRNKPVYIEITYHRPVPLNHYVLAAKKMTVVKEGEKRFEKEVVKHLFSEALDKHEKARLNKKGKHQKDKKKPDKVEQGEKPKEGEEGKEEEKKEESSDDGEDDEEDEGDEEESTTGQTPPVDIEAIKDMVNQPEKKEKLTKEERQYQKKSQKQQNKAALHHKYQGGPKLNKANNDLKQNVQLIIEKELYPCVVFVFSRKQCSELCLGMVGIDALTSREKNKVKQFIKKAVNKLDPDDRNLHQIKELEFCLEQGVAYHHAGLLPILKEIVEILFAEGLIKVLFATTTFAMGLNMPARAVMFIKLEKFNGREEVFLEASEYLQMAGRAGRRGKDDVGYSIMYFEKAQMFKNQGIADKMNDMMNIKSGNLESKYKLTYRIILHVLGRGETGMKEIQKIMRSSFLENDNYKAKLFETERIKMLEQKLGSCEEIE
jgi:antiviral helicase SKI2